MFKNLTLFRLPPDWFPSLEEFETYAGAMRFTPCGASQEKSAGFVPPRGEENGALIEFVDGQRVLRFSMEVKSVPGAHVTAKVTAQAAEIERQTGRKPGKKELRELKDDAIQALLPQVLPKRSFAWIWIDFKGGLLCIDATSQNLIDTATSALVQAFDGLSLGLLHTRLSPQAAMSAWVQATDPDEWPEGISLERDLELRSNDDEKSIVRFQRHQLDNAEVRKHITEGKLPTRLGLSWEGRVAFEFTEALRIKKIKFLEGVFDQSDAPHADEFDSDVAISTGELSKMLPALISALGGQYFFAENSSPKVDLS